MPNAKTGSRWIALFALAFPRAAHAQVQTNVVALSEIAQKATREFAAERLRAERLAKLLGIPMRIETETGVAEIYKFLGRTPLYRRTCNVEAAKTSSTDKVWPGGPLGYSLNGATEVLAIWDGGTARATHQEFGTRVTIGDGGTQNNHPTAVAGTMIAAGLSPEAKGMSFAATLRSYDWNDDANEMASLAATGLLVSNHSYGVWGQQWMYGFYDSYSRIWDEIAYNAPYYTIFQAAGNEQGKNSTKGIWDTLAMPAAAKNCVTCGSVQAIAGGFTGDVTKIILSGTSSMGPTDDGRIKPDVVGCGVGIYTLTNSSDTSYGYWSGTSFSTPNVSGSAALLQQLYKSTHGNTPMRSATLRGLLIHTAEDAGNAGPDYKFGWGLINTGKAATVVSAGLSDPLTIQERTLASGGAYAFEVASSGTEPLKVTICWTDPAGTPPVEGTLDPPNLMLVNDLDLRISRAGTTYQPFILDPASPSARATTGDNFRDNVEQVLIPAPAPGIYTVRVTHKGASLKPSGQQAYTVIVTGNAPRLASVSTAAASVMGGLSTTGKVVLSKPAPAGGVSVALTASDPSAVSLPAAVAIPEGATEAEFVITTAKRESATTVEIRAELWGEPKSTNLTVSATPKVSGVVTLGDFGGDRRTIPVTVTIRQPGTSTVLDSATVTLDAAGNYWFLTTQVGTFDLGFQAPHWLRKVLKNVSITVSGASGQSPSLVNGDVNGDNRIDVLDFNKLSLAWRSTPASSNWNPNADLNGDRSVNILDWNVLSKNWRKIGDL